MKATTTGGHLSLQDAADALGVSEVTARRWVKSGKLKAYQPGRRYLIPRSAVDDLLRPSEGSPVLTVADPRVREWLRDQGASFALMTRAEFSELVLDVGTLEGVEELVGEVGAEDLAVERALMREFRDGGDLFPETPAGPDEWTQTLARTRAVTRLQRALEDDYQGLRRALVNYSRKLYLSGRADDFLAHPKEAEATPEVTRQRILEEAMTEELVSA